MKLLKAYEIIGTKEVLVGFCMMAGTKLSGQKNSSCPTIALSEAIKVTRKIRFQRKYQQGQKCFCLDNHHHGVSSEYRSIQMQD